MSDFLLKVDPTEIIAFVDKKLGEEACSTPLKLTNPTSDRYIWKVKCTSNEMFRIRPPVGALKANETVSVQLTFNAGKAIPDNGKHYFVIYYLKCTSDDKPARQAWNDAKPDEFEGTKRLYINFNNEPTDKLAADEKDKKEKHDDDTPKKEEKADDKEKDKEKEKNDEGEKK